MKLMRYGAGAVFCILGTTSAVPSQAEYGVEPSVADTSGAIENGPPTPMFNFPDGIWNNGEGFAPDAQVSADIGGYFGIDDGTNLGLNDVVASASYWTPWAQHTEPRTGLPVRRYVGFLRPSNLPATQTPPADGFAAETAFEIFVPDDWDLRALPDPNDVVVVIATWPTIGSMPQGRNGYIGDPTLAGLRANALGGVFRPACDYYAAMSDTGDTVGIDIVSAYIVSPIPNQDLSLTVQRTLQLERAVKLLLEDPVRAPLGVPVDDADEIPVVITGGSFGGLTAQIMPIFYPDRFHGAVPNSFSGSVRRTMDDQEGYTFHSSLCGFRADSQAYGLLNTLQWANFFRDYPAQAPDSFTGVGYYEASFLTLWEKADSSAPIHHPMYWLYSDEDTVTQGTEWATVLNPSPGTRNGYMPANSATPSAPNTGTVYWTAIDRGCHDAYRYKIPAAMLGGGNDRPEEDLTDAIFPFLPVALQQFPGAASLPSRPDFSNIRDLSGPSDDHGPFEWAIARKSVDERRTQLGVGPTTALTEDTSFIDQHGAMLGGGIGTWLGHEGSLIADGADIYVGSADGIVSKLQYDAPSAGKRLKVAGQCQFQGTLSLGFGVRGLAIKDNHLFVATQRRLYRFDKNTLQSTITPVDLPWSESRPALLVVKKLWGGTTDYLIYKTFYGELVVRNLDLSLVTQYTEPGIRDFVVYGSTTGNWSRPIYILSERGRIVKIRVLQPDTLPATVRVDAFSANQDTDPLDITVDGSGNVVALYRSVDGQNDPIADTIREFTPDLALIRSYSNVGNEPGFRGAGKSWTSVGRIEPFADGYVVLRGGILTYVDLSSTGIGIGGGSSDPTETSGDLDGFRAAYHPLALAVVDVDGDGDEDVVLSTEDGQVVWLPKNVVTSGDLSSIETLVEQQDRHAHSTGGVVATWGITADAPDGKLHVIDQNGRQWRIETDPQAQDPIGTATWQHDVPTGFKPYCDLGYFGFDPDPGDDSDWVFLQPGFMHLGRLDVQIPVVPPANTFMLPGDWPVSGRSWVLRSHYQYFLSQFMPFHYCGDVVPYTDAQATQHTVAYWWSGVPTEGPTTANYNNLILAVDRSDDQPTASFDWASSAPTTNDPQIPFDHFRNVITGDVGYSQQSLRAGFWDRPEPYVVGGTSGGGVLIADPIAALGQKLEFPLQDGSRYFTNERDEGYGGQALAVATVRGERPTIFFGTLHTHADDESRDMVSSLHLWDWSGPGGGLEGRDYVLDGTGDLPKLYGLCGIAIGNLLDDTTPEVPEETVLTTLNGDLVVFDLETDENNQDERVKLGAKLYWQVFDGALGACNGLLIGDLDGDGEPELYVASTLGVRKFTPVNP